MQRPPPHVIVVAYGPVDLLRVAIAPLSDHFRIHVIDNGRSDAVREGAAAGGHDYVRPPRNVGFGAAVNIGLNRVPSDVDVLLLNPDARVTAEDVRVLQSSLHERPWTAAVAPLLRRPDGSLEPTRWPMPTPRLAWRAVIGRGRLRSDEPYFVSGAVLLLRGEALRTVGPFDERFFLYAEEVDWQKRAQLAGYTVREVTNVHALHLGGATSSNKRLRDAHFHGSAELYVRKWFGPVGWWFFRTGSLVAALRRAATASAKPERLQALRTARLYARGPASLLPNRPNG